MIRGLFKFHRNKAATVAAMRAVSQSPMVICPSRMQAPRIWMWDAAGQTGVIVLMLRGFV